MIDEDFFFFLPKKNMLCQLRFLGTREKQKASSRAPPSQQGEWPPASPRHQQHPGASWCLLTPGGLGSAAAGKMEGTGAPSTSSGKVLEKMQAGGMSTGMEFISIGGPSWR